MPPEMNYILPFLTFSTTVLVLLSSYRRMFSVIAIVLMLSYVGLDTLLTWDSLKNLTTTLMDQGQKSLTVLIVLIGLLVMTPQKKLLDLTLNLFVITPLLFGVALSTSLFYFTVTAVLILAFVNFRVSRNLSLKLLNSIVRNANLEILLILVFGILGMFTESVGQFGHHFIFPYMAAILFSFLYILIQGPINVKLIQDGLPSDKALLLAIPKSVVFLQLILLSHELYTSIEVSYQEGLSDFIFLAGSVLLGVLIFPTLLLKSREDYSKTYIISQFTIVASLVVLGIPSGKMLLLGILLLDTVISFCVLVRLNARSLTGFLFGLQTALVPIGVVFFSKLVLIRFIIVESGYHPFSYLVLFNQVCLSVMALRLISSENIGKINLSLRHAVYLSCVIIGACLVAILN